ncbi:MAG: hypothetical protein Q7O66_09310 [Dehalococcoidia bacterium]|nr:hypothetical protein [Dehalococcoidia bacterium]
MKKGSIARARRIVVGLLLALAILLPAFRAGTLNAVAAAANTGGWHTRGDELMGSL